MKFEDQIRRTIRFWSFRLLVGHEDDVAYPRLEDLQSMAITKAYAPQTIIKLGIIWNSADPQRGGVTGVSKYLSKLVTNCLNDHLRKEIPRTKNLVEGDAPVMEDGDGDGISDLWAFISDEIPEYQSFLLPELQDELKPGEFELIVECALKEATLKQIADASGTSVRTTRRKLKMVKAKVKSTLEEMMQARMRYGVPRMNRASLRPDRMSKEVLKNWKLPFEINTYTVCLHLLPGENGERDPNGWPIQDFNVPGAVRITGRWALCRTCWKYYWAEFDRQMTLSMFYDLGTEGLAEDRAENSQK